MANRLNNYLLNKGLVPERFYKLDNERIAICTGQLSDMTEIKQISQVESYVLYVQSGSEVKLGYHVTEKEKQEYYKRVQKQLKKQKKKNKKRKKKTEDL